MLCYTWSHLYSSSSPLLQTQDRIEHFRLNKVVLLLPFIEIELAAHFCLAHWLQQQQYSQNVKIANEYFD